MKYNFLSQREKEFLHDPEGFEQKHGNNYTRQIRHRIRTKLGEALGIVETIYHNIWKEKDNRKSLLLSRFVLERGEWLIPIQGWINSIVFAMCKGGMIPTYAQFPPKKESSEK